MKKLRHTHNLEVINQIYDLLEEQRVEEALPLAQELAEKSKSEEILGLLLECGLSLSDQQTITTACAYLFDRKIESPEVMWNLALGLGLIGFQASSILRLRACARSWRNQDLGIRAGKFVEKALPAFLEGYRKFALKPEEIISMSSNNDRVQLLMAREEFDAAESTAISALEKFPMYTPLRNNLSICFFQKGENQKAYVTSIENLEFDPKNVHALSNAIIYSFRAGKLDRARALLTELDELPIQFADHLFKKIEALAYLEEWELIIQAFELGNKTLNPHPHLSAEIAHYVAYANLMIGKELNALEIWKGIRRTSRVAEEILLDMDLPPGEQWGPWLYSLYKYISPATIRAMQKLVGIGATATDKPIEKFATETDCFKHALKHGDEKILNLLVEVIPLMKNDELSKALFEFAKGNRGNDEIRAQALRALQSKILLPSEVTISFKRNGVYSTVVSKITEVGQSTANHLELNPKDEAQFGKAIEFMAEGEPKKAQKILQKLSVAYPTAVPVLQNLAVCYFRMGDERKALLLTEQILSIDESYLFARCTKASIEIVSGNVDEAERWVKPLLERTSLHPVELRALAGVMMRLEEKKGNIEASEHWRMLREQTAEDPSRDSPTPRR